eukprot:4674326-Amphidinium_carterae.1
MGYSYLGTSSKKELPCEFHALIACQHVRIHHIQSYGYDYFHRSSTSRSPHNDFVPVSWSAERPYAQSTLPMSHPTLAVVAALNLR